MRRRLARPAAAPASAPPYPAAAPAAGAAAGRRHGRDRRHAPPRSAPAAPRAASRRPGDHAAHRPRPPRTAARRCPSAAVRHVPPHATRSRAGRAGSPHVATIRRRNGERKHIYDLTLLLDPAVEAERREQIVADVADLIDRTGEFIGRHDWGIRQTAYEVRKKAEADYHLIQFRGRASCSSSSTTT